MTYCWLSWWHDPTTMGEFEMHTPWWVSGEDMRGRKAIIAAIPTDDPEKAAKIVMKSFDKKPKSLEFRFNSVKQGSPFCDRFRPAKWMRWPGGKAKAASSERIKR
jgi:hypothetical protein